MTPDRYDVFLSHSSSDKSIVERIATKLVTEGLSPFLDRWELVPGTPWQEALEHALQRSAHCAVFIGPSSITAWAHEELRVALSRRVADPTFRVIPVALPGADMDAVTNWPPFLGRLTWVDLRGGPDEPEAFRVLLSAIRGVAPGKPGIVSSTVVDQSGIVHPLPPAPRFVGRVAQLTAIASWWDRGDGGICALLGIGGSGKTAIAAEFIGRLLKGKSIVASGTDATPPHALFVWSFYVDQNVDTFLRTLYAHVTRGKTLKARGAAATYLLIDALAKSGRTLLVLDGLERVQRERSDARRRFGDVEDSLLRQLIRRLAAGLGQTYCLVTSRFPLSDVEPWAGLQCQFIDADRLSRQDAIAIVKQNLPNATSLDAHRMVDEFGEHALTLDHACSYVRELCHGRISEAVTLPTPTMTAVAREERQLARVLSGYEQNLTAIELDLLSCLALFRFGTTLDTLEMVFKAATSRIDEASARITAAELRTTASRMVSLHLLLHEAGERYTAHPAVRDYFARRVLDPTRIHSAVQSHYSQLAARPGTEHPTDQSTLDLLEEVIYHALAAGQHDEAAEVYKNKLGGAQHLGYRLGEFARGLRILRGFAECPFWEDLVTYLRALGEIDEAISLLRRVPPRARTPVLLLAGRLKEATEVTSEKYDFSSAHQIRLLTGEETRPVSTLFANKLTALLHPHIAFYLGEPFRKILLNLRDHLCSDGKHTFIFGNDAYGGFAENAEQHVRSELSLAELHRQSGDIAQAEAAVARTNEWVATSGSQELICLRLLTTARLTRTAGALEDALGMLAEAVHIAQHAGLVVYHIDLSLEQARCHLATGDLPSAGRQAGLAIYGALRGTGELAPQPTPRDQLAVVGALHPTLNYRWAACDGLLLLADVQARKGEQAEALQLLRRATHMDNSLTEGNEPHMRLTHRLWLCLGAAMHQPGGIATGHVRIEP